jgi:AhpD family alkylhydroperoxidase
MRLDALEHGHRLPARLFQRLGKVIFRHEMGDDGKTLMYRPEFFGRPFLDYSREVLRGQSYWTAGEREYLASFTSRLNECPFCVRLHSETTRIEAHGEFDITEPASTRPQLAVVTTLLEKVSLNPDDVSPADIDAVRGAGVPDDAIVDALHLNLIVHTMNRLANAFDWTWDSEDHVRAGARAIHLFGYKLPSFVMR